MRKPQEELHTSEDILALSFLDVLSCGLGASVFLFLIFSLMPHLGSQAGGANAPRKRSLERAADGSVPLHERARYTAFEVEVTIANASNVTLPADPWNASLPLGAEVFQPVVRPGGARLVAVYLPPGTRLRNPLEFVLSSPTGGTVRAGVVIYVGGSRWGTPQGPRKVEAGGGVVLRVDFSAATEEQAVVWLAPPP